MFEELLGNLVGGFILGTVKTIRGNANTAIEGMVLYGISAGIDYFTENKISDFFAGVAEASFATAVTELTSFMQRKKQVFIPADESVIVG